MKQQIRELHLDEPTLAEDLAVELTEAEVEQVGGGRWVQTDTGTACDGEVYIN